LQSLFNHLLLFQTSGEWVWIGMPKFHKRKKKSGCWDADCQKSKIFVSS